MIHSEILTVMQNNSLKTNLISHQFQVSSAAKLLLELE